MIQQYTVDDVSEAKYIHPKCCKFYARSRKSIIIFIKIFYVVYPHMDGVLIPWEPGSISILDFVEISYSWAVWVS